MGISRATCFCPPALHLTTLVTEGRRIDERRRARSFRMLALFLTLYQKTKCRSFCNSHSHLSDERRLKGSYPMSQNSWCVTDGLSEQRVFSVAVLQMSLPHCCLVSLALPNTNKQGEHPEAAEMSPDCGPNAHSCVMGETSQRESAHAKSCMC